MEEFEKKLLIGNDDEAKQEALIKDFIDKYGAPSTQPSTQQQANYKTVEPNPQFCIKIKSEGGAKVFLNLCTAEHIPSPKEISDADLVALLESEDPSGYRVPMSLGEPHAEVDKSGNGCTAYDIVISDQFCSKIKTNDLFMGFFMSVITEGLDNKYNVKLSRDWVKLKNKKCMGKILPQYIRTASKPWIMEMDESSKDPGLIPETKPAQTTPVTRKSIEPKCRIVQEPTSGHPEFLVAEIDLPEVKTSKSITLDIGEDCILLDTRSKLYHLEVYLPFNLVQQESGAQFNKQTRRLTVTLPVQPQQPQLTT